MINSLEQPNVLSWQVAAPSNPNKGYTRDGYEVTPQEQEDIWQKQIVANNPDRAKKTQQVQDSENDAISNLARELGMKLDSETKDYITKYYLDEQSNTKAWFRQMDASNTQYQRAVADLKKAGLNPFLAIQSLSGSSPSSSGTSAQGGLYTSRKNAQQQQATSVGTTIFTVLALLAATLIKAIA